jgi:hypothetical protein
MGSLTREPQPRIPAALFSIARCRGGIPRRAGWLLHSETWVRGRGKMLVGAFGGLEGWFRPKVVRLEYLLDAEDEKVVRRLRTKGHELHWTLETRLRELQRDGWKPVTQWDKTGRRSIFMDGREEIILLHRPPAKTST